MLLRDVQMHPFRQQVLHIDFQRVDAKKKIHMKVPLHFMNADIAPGVKTGGGNVSHVMNELDITCLPDDLPEFIEVDLANLALGPLDPPVRSEAAHRAWKSRRNWCAATKPWSLPCNRVPLVEPRAEVAPQPKRLAVEAAPAAAAAAAPGAVPAAAGAKKEPEEGRRQGRQEVIFAFLACPACLSRSWRVVSFAGSPTIQHEARRWSGQSRTRI